MALYAEIVNGVIRQTVSDGQPVRMADGTQYPGNWPKSDIAGLTPVVMAAPPASDVTVTGSTVTLVNGVPTQELQTAPIPAATILQQQAAAALSAGLSITSTGTPALNGTYRVASGVPFGREDIGTEAQFVSTFSEFTNGATTLDWPLIDGKTFVTFPTTASFMNFAKAAAQFFAACKAIAAIGAGSLPTASATIP